MRINRWWRRSSFIIHYFAFLVFYSLCLFSYNPFISLSPWLHAEPEEDITRQINTIIYKHELHKSYLAIKVISLSDYETIYEKNADDLMIIASNVKLFTTATALCKLGPDYKFTTTLFYNGSIKDNVLDGNLIVKSNGDPNISGRFYDNNSTAIFGRWAEELFKSGIRNISGNIIIDDSAFDREYYIPSWPVEQLSYWYCAPISAVSFNDNCVEITVFKDTKSDKIKYSVSPPTQYVDISLEVIIDNKISDNQITFYREPKTNYIAIKGKMGSKCTPEKEFVTIHNPPLFFGTVLKECLKQKGIVVQGRVLSQNTSYKPADKLVKVSEMQTDLVQAINVVNKRSQNFYAEQVLKSLSYRYEGKGTFGDGLKIIRDFLSDVVGIKRGAFYITDGSGLSRTSNFSANQIIDMLAYMNRHKYFTIFRDSLNTEKWTLKKKETSQPILWAKSGYLKNALSLSGYALRGNDYYAFSLVINNFESLPDGLKNAEEFRDEFAQLLQQF